MNNTFDIAIVGGGIVGLATAYKLQTKFPKLKLLVLEKESKLAQHQTGRNSGVLHSGLYYKPNSLKANNCVKGRQQLVNYAIENNINHDVCGKIVVAITDDQCDYLHKLKSNGEKNNLSGLKILSKKEFQSIEPYADGLSALWVPQSGIINYEDVTNSLARNIVSLNKKSKILTKCKLLNYSNQNLQTSRGEFFTKHIIFCGGLFSDRLASSEIKSLDFQIVGFRGDYFKLKNNAKHMVKNLIYPVPNPKFPFLGVHFTRMTNGDIECGPNAVFTFKREGYNKTAFNLKDTFQALSFSGTRKLFINNWKFGLNEYSRAFSKFLFLKELRKMLPSLTMNDIIEHRSGVRAMALSKDGSIIDDFKVIKTKNNIHVLNAPSPAATACLSIGDYITNEAKIQFKL
ncbi:MAG: L-2-hydroxyglutarate oxidase [Flavobacteriales bacterium]|nr:L-2-hydroxyglutarate oxidase [Flavobacteriales bacterium]